MITSEVSFASLGLAEPLLRAISESGYTQPTPIQAQAIPLVLAGGDLLAAAQTGTGKTAGFTLPLLHRLSTTSASAPKAGRPRCLILTPTRELAAQVEESVQTYGKHLPLTSMVMFGGVNINPQIAALKKRVDILVATPGRLLDHAGQKTVDLSGVEILVLDEADRMLDMGFIRDIRKVLALLPKQRQNLLFSATFSDEIRSLANGLLNNPGCVEVARRNTTTELVEQSVYSVPQKQKRDLLVHLVKEHDWHQVLVFTRTKHGANRLAEYLGKHGIPAAAIHGNKSQAARTRALSQFKDNSLPVLVATDIAARGLDIDQLPQVVNFELPNVPEDYVHRIGRTGRAGATGKAISFVDSEERPYLASIERLIKRTIERATVPEFVTHAPDPGDNDRPPRDPRQSSGRRNDGRAPRQPQTERPAPRAQAHGANRQPSRQGTQGAAANGGKPANRPARSGEAQGNRTARNGEANRSGAPRAQEAGANRAPRTADAPRAAARPDSGRSPAPRAALFSAKPGNRGDS
ncbi:DEAD/DEAH box helicase [Aromatoleum evansii]|uniref:ATP-dependent RNA helicase RhlE n=1 Tax=Aromatoleum evansii TaxID=59406 RepID=A0ABZ1AM40_AROEV|nr:DEAD/DEAH box helicase [Aromatoleum evansii]NMG28625.1 DEAD/DEAH box helicase [Aromatoleum evansii]WRL45994.1 DEAD/DEAH box helicase [Aromatoleum evansii]